MRINNNSYTDRLMRDEFREKYSRTAQAINGDFRITLEEAIRRRTEIVGPDTLIARAAQDYARAKDISGRMDTAITAHDDDNADGRDILMRQRYLRAEIMRRPDTLIASAAQDYARAKDISGQHDPVITAQNSQADKFTGILMDRISRKPDTLIASAAQDYARAMNISERYDPVLARNGDLA